MVCNKTISSFLITDLASIPLIKVPSQFTLMEANYCQQLLSRTLEQSSSQLKKVILDFGATTFIDKDGLIGLWQIIKLAKNIQADLSFLGFSPQVQMVLSLAGLEDSLAMVDLKSNYQ